MYRGQTPILFLLLLFSLVVSIAGEDCGSQAGGRICAPGICCSKWGWCGITPDHCGEGCQSQCSGSSVPPPPPPSSVPPPPPPSIVPPAPPSGDGVGSIITRDIFDSLFKHRGTPPNCGGAFYTYDAFISAANSFPAFGTTGSLEERRRELAAFLAQTSHETTGGWPDAPDGPFRWGYCFVEEIKKGPYCEQSPQWPCNPSKQYFGRGPIQLSWNYNYGQAGVALGFDGINDPDIVSRDPLVSFKTAIWFWMTPQSPKPSCHDAILGIWTPSPSDLAAGRVPGYGAVTNIINGGLECGIGVDPRVQNRIGFFTSYCDFLGVNPGPNLDCYSQRPFGVGLATM